jgi:hypothetical protein
MPSVRCSLFRRCNLRVIDNRTRFARPAHSAPSERILHIDRRADARRPAPQTSQGERVGNIHYGYRLAEDGKHVEPDAVEQEVLATIRALRCRRRSLREIGGTERTRPTDPPRFSLALRVRQERDQ